MTRPARELWRVVEPFHQVAYRSPEAVTAYESLGLTPGPQQYFANRLAVLGSVGPTTASAVLFGFNPSYVSSVIPHVWCVARPEEVVAARLAAARSCLVRIVPDLATNPLTGRFADIARRLTECLDFSGSPLGAACFDQPCPEDPVSSLWHSCTVLREHRGDAHWRATASNGIDPVECHLLHAADGAMPEDLLQRVSGWDDASWSTAKERLVKRGLVRIDGTKLDLTHEGRATKRAIEVATDAHADHAIETVGAHHVGTMREGMRPWIASIMEADVIGAWKMREELWRDE